MKAEVVCQLLTTNINLSSLHAAHHQCVCGNDECVYMHDLTLIIFTGGSLQFFSPINVFLSQFNVQKQL